MEEEQKMDLLIKYWQLLTMENDFSLATREKWLIAQLKNFIDQNPDSPNTRIFTYAVDLIEENRNTIDGLQMVFDDMYD
jgi:hypothetical protein